MKTRLSRIRYILQAAEGLLSERREPAAHPKNAPREQRKIALMGSPVPVHILATTRQELVTRSKSLLKEPWTSHWIQHYIKRGDVMFDIGANIGAFSLFCAAVHHRAVNIYAFEPGFANYNALCRNLLLNGCDDSVVPVPLVLSSQTGTTVFKYRSIESGGARHAMGARSLEAKPGDRLPKPVYEQVVFAITLDEMSERYGLPVPAHLKIDVDGNEEAVLAGARKTLAAPGVRSVMVEIAEHSDRDRIIGLLDWAGLTLAREFDKLSGTRDVFFGRDNGDLAAVLSTAPERMTDADLKRLRA